MAGNSVIYSVLPLILALVHSAVGQTVSTVCKTSDDCMSDRLCADEKCIDPCQAGVCGHNTLCHVSDHTPMCACQRDYDGHPFTGCYPSSSSKSREDKPKQKYYHLYHDQMNWFQSLSHCNSLNMRLAAITSQEEQDKLVVMIKKSNGGSGNYWVGGADHLRFGGYLWMSTGQPIVYHNFRFPQPDNEEGEHCMELRQEYDWAWSDNICESKQFRVCEEFH